MAALDVTNVRIELTINGVAQTPINADATTTTDVLPRISVGDKVSGKAYIYVDGEATPRVADLDETEIVLSNTLKFKVPYNYRVLDAPVDGSELVSGTYFSREGINLSTYTNSPITGWKCLEDNTSHFGSIVAGVRGDITLVPLYGSGASLTVVQSQLQLLAKADTSFNDTATLTISGGSGAYSVTPDSSSASVIDCTGSGSSWTVSIKTDTTPGATGKVMFADNTTVTINVTDTVSGEPPVSVSLTLKNEYSLTIGYSTNEWVSSTTFNASDTFNFSSVPVTSLGIPSGRQIVAYKDATTNTTYKITTTPPDTLTFSSALGRREVYLDALLDFTITTKDAGNPSQIWTGTAHTDGNGNTGLLYTLEKYSTTTKELRVAVTDCSTNSNLSVAKTGDSQNFLEIAQSDLTSSGTFIVKLTSNVTHDSITPGYQYTITVTDSGTGAKKYLFIEIAQPPEYKYSLKYRKPDNTLVDIPGQQNITFTPGSSITFGGLSGTLKMGDLVSTLTGVEAAIEITGWTGTGAYNLSYPDNPFPNVGANDCRTDGSVTLIATTTPDIGTFYNNCRANSNLVQNGDVMLSTGLCVDKTYYTNNRTFLDPYVAGAVCILSGGQKFVVAKNPGKNSLRWADDINQNIGGLQINVSAYTGSPLDITPSLTVPYSTGKDSLSTLTSAGEVISDYPPFEYCAGYKPIGSGVSTGSYINGWYLPSLAEALAINKNRDSFPAGFVADYPWLMTSSQYSQTHYWLVQGGTDAGTGSVTVFQKTTTSQINNVNVYPCHEFSFNAPPQ